MTAYTLSGVMLEMVGPKKGLSLAFGISSIGGLAITVYGLYHQDSWSFLLLILIAKFGISSAFNIIYISHARMFPTLFAATSFGFCNFLARVFTIASPLVSQVK